MVFEYFKILIIYFLLTSSLIAREWIAVGTNKPAEPDWEIKTFSDNDIEISFDLSGYYTEKVGGGKTRITFPGGVPILEKGAPDLPCMANSIFIPELAQMEIEVIEANYVDVPALDMISSKGNITRDINIASIPNIYGTIYEIDEFYPKEIAFLRDPYILRSFRGQAVVFQPFQYNPISRILRVYTDIKIRVYQNGISTINPLVRRPAGNNNSREYNNIYGQHFLNFSSSSIRYEPIVESGRMLVICYGPFMEAIQPLVDWKNLKGMPTELVDFASIGETAADIDEYVGNYYYNEGLTYLLLVGDIDQIPSLRYSEGAGSNSPADPAYSFISGNDYYPDIFVGRFSAEDTSHVNTMVTRTIYYERYPDTTNGQWYRKGSGFASNQGPGDDGEYDNEHLNVIRNKLLNYNYDEVDQVYDPSGTVEEGEIAINEGRSIINYTGHGSNSSWGNGCAMNNTDVNGLVNIGKFPFIWTVACVTGEFHVGTCFAETWLRATEGDEPTGAVASFNSTVNAAWNPPMDAQDEMNDIFVESYEDNIKRTFGGLSFNGCMHMNDNYGSQGNVETLYWTIFGDPSVMVRSDIPINLDISYENILIIGAEDFTIETGSNEALAAISRDGQLLGSGYSDETGSVTIIFDEPIDIPGELDLVVTAYNTIPYEATVNVIAPEGPYMLIGDVTIISNENDNRLQFGELTSLNVDIENVGTDNSDSITVILYQDDNLVSFNIQSLFIGSLESGADTTLGPFEFQVSYNLEDQSAIDFNLSIISGESTWEYPFTLSADAPDHSIASINIFDGENGLLDPGETVTVQLVMGNTGHAGLSSPTFLVQGNDPYLTIHSIDDDNTELWDVNGQIVVSVLLTSSSDAPLGHLALFNIEIGSLNTNYEYILPVSLVIGLMMDDFESGNFEAFDWTHSGDLSWVIQGSEVYSGSYAAKSGAIDDNQTSELSLSLNVIYDGEIQFIAKSSSEQQSGSGIISDYLAFYVDGSDMGEHISGTTDWQEYSFNIPAGEHLFKWVYKKNQTLSVGDDCVWLDRIIFPAGSVPVLNINFGDPNADGNINVLDIILSVGNVLGYNVFSTDQFLAADMNMDGTVNILDIMLLVDAALYDQ